MSWPGNARVDGLTPMQVAIVEVLKAGKGQLVTTQHIVEVLWPNPDTQTEGALKSVVVQIHSIRKKLGYHQIGSKSGFKGGYWWVGANG